MKSVLFLLRKFVARTDKLVNYSQIRFGFRFKFNKMNIFEITPFYQTQYVEICILYIIFLFIVILFLSLSVHIAQYQNENGTENE